MAGSKRWFSYTTDEGTVYGVFADESNTEAANATALTPALAVIDSIPGNVKVRKAYYRSVDGTRTVSCVVLTQARYNTIQTSVPSIPDPLDTASGGTPSQLFFLRKTAERRRAIVRVDSGITDGDIEQVTT